MARSKNQSITLDGKTYTRTVTNVTTHDIWGSMDEREQGWVKIGGLEYMVTRTYKWEAGSSYGHRYDDSNCTPWTPVKRDGAYLTVQRPARKAAVKISADAQAWLRDVFIATASKIIESREDATATDVYLETFDGMSQWSAKLVAGRDMPEDLEALDLWCDYATGISKAAMV